MSETNYVCVKSERNLYTVGFYRPDGRWEAESDWTRSEDAAAQVHYLNGGQKPSQPEVWPPRYGKTESHLSPETMKCLRASKNESNANDRGARLRLFGNPSGISDLGKRLKSSSDLITGSITVLSRGRQPRTRSTFPGMVLMIAARQQKKP